MKNLLSNFWRNLTFCLLVLCQLTANAQGNCEYALKEANDAYEEGKFTECVNGLLPCLDSIEQSSKYEGYRLLSMSYLALNQQNQAEKYAMLLLKTKPDYKDFPDFDPKSFSALLKRIDVWPKYEGGAFAGLNMNNFKIGKVYSVTEQPGTYVPLSGFQIGANVERFIQKNFSLNFAISYEGLNYRFESNNFPGWSQELTENLKYINIPVVARYSLFSKGNITLGVDGGLQLRMLSSTNTNVVFIRTETGARAQKTEDMSDQRIKSLISIPLGLQLKYKLSTGSFYTNLGYSMGLSNMVNTETRYDNLGFVIDNQYVDSDMTFSPLTFSFGFQLPIGHNYSVKLNK